jgi:hypothetical protein
MLWLFSLGFLALENGDVPSIVANRLDPDPTKRETGSGATFELHHYPKSIDRPKEYPARSLAATYSTSA